ncbi:hypothetical protein AGDE_12500 [Angomonas deanei]|uniref:Uncharacterized protein n=1 Tax=Angomonas deanei TaxID=59799 RepID=A0A7G2CDH6_9TRYP|nr:hypothetical protein AGDE_12500 [Angomonas deanei]CAD2217081.1 hypothetical protein, conserved [Angomonas deanei]|eukprot:EPY24103.1 hypothetical protein AGDE_12500 [Angomonas deanei]
MSQAPCLAKAAAKATATGGSARVKPVVANHLRIVQRDFLTRQAGRTSIRSSVAVDYSRPYLQKYKSEAGFFNHDACPRVIDAEAVHVDEQLFWTERRSFYNSKKPFFTVWDRQAQALVILSRRVVRAPTEAAFRIFALGFKMMQLPQLLNYSQVMLPTWTHGGMNVESLLREVKEQDGKKDAEKKEDKPEKKE